MAFIYTLEHPLTREIRYVGVTIQNPIKRLYSHCASLEKSNNRRTTWVKSLKKKGLRPVIQVIEEVLDDERYHWETFWIEQLKNWGFRLVNTSMKGSGGTTYVKKQKYRHTEEAKRKISIANSLPRDQAWILNSAKANKKAIVQYTLQGDFVRHFDSATDAALFLGDISKKKNITTVLKGRRHFAYGYVWRYKNTELQDKEPVG